MTEFSGKCKSYLGATIPVGFSDFIYDVKLSRR